MGTSTTRRFFPPCAIASKAILNPVAAGAISSSNWVGIAKKPHIES